MSNTRTRVVILGSTGSIGTQALELIKENQQLFEVVGLAAGGNNSDLLIAQAQTFAVSGEHVAVADAQQRERISEALGKEVISGKDAARVLVETVEADVVLNALVGSLGLDATLAALKTPARLALANKESLVAGGQLVLDAAAPGQLVPVDSEHSAMAQALRSGTSSEVDKLILTASGGPFRGWTAKKLDDVTPQQAAAHPTWAMGQMNTLNSATLVNKGLELIEASLLFGVPAHDIVVSVHPQSIVHSMVTFTDGATIAQASPPSMKLPIGLALNWPNRLPESQPALDFTQSSQWDFEPLDDDVFPAVKLARYALEQGGGMPAVYNAANEEAAQRFLERRLAFPRIVEIIKKTMLALPGAAQQPKDFDAVVALEYTARATAQEIMDNLEQ